jgi:hypothetical protein
MACSGALTWRVTLPLLQAWHSLHQSAISAPIPGHTNWDLISRFVVYAVEQQPAVRGGHQWAGGAS